MTVSLPQYQPWPIADLPVPRRVNYSASIDYGVRRSDLVSGLPVQSRLYGANQQIITCEFLFTAQQLTDFSLFMDQVGFRGYFSIPTATNKEDIIPGPAPHDIEIVRAIDSYQARPIGSNIFVVTCTFECLPRDIAQGYLGVGGDDEGMHPDVEYINWIIAGEPGDPANPDWVIAGTPGAPNADFVLAGAPVDHEREP